MASALIPTQAVTSPPPVNFGDYHSAYLTLEIDRYPPSLRQTVGNVRRLLESQFICTSQLLGQGTVGIVYRGHYEKKGAWSVACAVKVFNDVNHARDEAQMIWKSAGAPHSIGFHGFRSVTWNGVEKRALILDLAQGSQLHTLSFAANLLVSKRQEVISIFRQLLEFLAGIQATDTHRTNPLIYGDLSGDNLFWDSKTLTVIDFSIVAEKGALWNPVVQKSTLRAPEVFLNQLSELNKGDEAVRYSESVDIWSVGVIVHGLVIGTPLIYTYDPRLPHGYLEIATLVRGFGMPPASYLDRCVATSKYFDKTNGTYALKPALAAMGMIASFDQQHALSVGSSPGVFDLLKSIFIWDPEKRPTPAQALKHNLFR